IREEFGLRVTFLMMLGILITNFGNVVGEFIGIVGSMGLFGVSKYIAVPICAVIVWLIAVKGQYKSVEKVFLAALFFYITYIFAGVLAKPAWIEAVKATVKPPQMAAFRQGPYLYMVIGIVGTTIAPWMQFYLNWRSWKKEAPRASTPPRGPAWTAAASSLTWLPGSS